MPETMYRRDFIGAAAGVIAPLAAPGVIRAADTYRLRCSLDTAPTHMRNRCITDYLDKLEAGSEGRIKPELFHGPSPFSDAYVPKALLQGHIEMGCPGTWVLTDFVPDCDAVNLPVLYGRPTEICLKVMDGKTGALINERLSRKLRSRVIGPWLHLGFQNWYSAGQPITTFEDLKGMRIRNPGGPALAWRTRWFKAVPGTTAWPDVPLALSSGTFDGLITTNESAFSARLWENGLKSSIQDHQNVNNYIPLVSEAFLASLPRGLQSLVIETWLLNVLDYRVRMLEAQKRALAGLRENGMVDTTPSAEEIAAIRGKMMADESKLAQELGLSPQVLKLVEQDIG